MQYQIYSKNIDITDSLREYIDIKFKAIERLADAVTSCRLDLSRDQHHKKGDVFRFEINMNVPGSLLRVVKTNQDMRAAVDIAMDALEQQMTKYKTRGRDHGRRISRIFKYFKREGK
jgi:putative sigma-54 modulation protein